jgi:hypothetical protein
MPTNYKILGQTAPTAATETLHYTVPTSTSTMVKSINVTNRSANPDTYSVAILPSVLPVTAPVFIMAETSIGDSYYSTDGVTYAAMDMPNKADSSEAYKSIAYGSGVIVAVVGGLYGSAIAATSTNGVTWTQRTLPVSQHWQTATYGQGLFVAMGGGFYGNPDTTAFATSTNGITWTSRTLPTSCVIGAVTFANNIFAAVAYGVGDTDTALAFSSTDGITWTNRTLPFAASWRTVTYGDGKFVAFTHGGSGAGAYSTDGITWTQMSQTVQPRKVVYGGDKFVMVGPARNYSTSTNGITWTARSLPSDVGSSFYVSIAYGNGLFTYLNAGANYISTDGITWTANSAFASDMLIFYAETETAQSTANSNYIAFNNTIAGNSTETFKAGYTLPASGGIRAISTNGTTTFSTFGAEIS